MVSFSKFKYRGTHSLVLSEEILYLMLFFSLKYEYVLSKAFTTYIIPI